MPSASQYREAAQWYRWLGESCHRLAGAVAGWRMTDHLGRGSLSELLAARLDVAAVHLRTAGDELARVTAVCEQRAEICERYRRQLIDYLQLPVLDRVRAPRPIPPYPWVSP